MSSSSVKKMRSILFLMAGVERDTLSLSYLGEGDVFPVTAETWRGRVPGGWMAVFNQVKIIQNTITACPGQVIAKMN